LFASPASRVGVSEHPVATWRKRIGIASYAGVPECDRMSYRGCIKPPLFDTAEVPEIKTGFMGAGLQMTIDPEATDTGTDARFAPDALQRNAARIDAVYQAAEVVGDDDPSMLRLLRIAAQLTGARFAAFSLVAEKRSIVKAALGFDHDTAGLLWPLDQAVVAADRPLVGPELAPSASPLLRALQQQEIAVGHYAGIPIRMPNGLVVGVLSVVGTTPIAMSVPLQKALEDIGALAEGWILLRSASIVDVLTGLFNRRYFEELVAREWRRSLRHLAPVAMLMIDIDYFKVLNDALGHEAGDAALRQVAAILKAQFRRGGDVVARYGGEEFVTVLPDTAAETAMALARRALRAIEDAQLKHPDSPYEALTVSIGVATAASTEEHQRGPIWLLTRADQALYEAKRRGRNRAVFDSASAYR
jgi:diguanylate cyclase (GGDEF)-like protein